MADGDVVEIKTGKRLVKGSEEARAHMQALADRRAILKAERIARGEEPSPGRRRKFRPLTEAEIREATKTSASELLYGDRAAAVDVLRKQMQHKDPAVSQRAAVKILEYTDGKPAATVNVNNTGQPTEVVYVTAALADVPVDDEGDRPFVPQAINE